MCNCAEGRTTSRPSSNVFSTCFNDLTKGGFYKAVNCVDHRQQRLNKDRLHGLLSSGSK
jgi:hypothetical protein